MRLRRAMRASLLAAIAGLPFVSFGVAATTAAASPAPITIAYITDLTGEGAAENSASPAGFEARIDMQNAQGGVNGHKLVPLVIDDQTSPSEITTAVQDAISKGAFGIVAQSPVFFLAAKYPQEAGMPVTGAYHRRSRMGHAALHEHVRLRRRQREPEVSGQHDDRLHLEGAWRHGARCLRVRHLADLHSGRRG